MKFSTLVGYFEKLEATRKRLEMFDLLAELFQLSGVSEIDKIIYMTQGELLPPFHGVNIGMSEKYLLRAISEEAGVDLNEVSQEFRVLGDLGKVSEKYFKNEGKEISVEEVYQKVHDIASVHGEGSVDQKIHAVATLLGAASSVEAKYITRFLAGKLRLGSGDATVLEALALSKGDRAYRSFLDRAYHITSDLGLVARTFFQSGEKGVRDISVRLGYPIRPALCERLSSSEEIIEKIGRCSVEAKYDGFRCQVHQGKDDFAIFSRNQERTTPMFPEIEAAMRQLFQNEEVILEGEALAYDELTGDLSPFQVTIQRKRKHGISEFAKKVPLRFFVFDLLYYAGVDYTGRPYHERRSKLLQLIKKNDVIEVSRAVETGDPEEVTHFFDEAVEQGLEGIVVKRLEGPYAAGSRNFNWIKLKRSYKGELSDSVDLCIIGYYAGKGKRANFGIGTILSAVYDKASDRFKTISKVGTGFSEEELIQLKDLLDQIRSPKCPADIDSEMTPDVWVLPKYIVTVTADEITRSPSHTAGRGASGIGYALRFPRVQGFIRSDKSEKEATTVSEIVSMFKRQKNVKMG
ncbi:MAG: ATP-dependent DNA ligase [Nitrospira sp.]|nr:ATP-dependent DNA ligase [Candidatus Manganitrophaceae bacterium]HIL34012.1 ATP-dependent DNA ligase [Candidatus Manganitrophaceae bacterium]